MKGLFKKSVSVLVSVCVAVLMLAGCRVSPKQTEDVMHNYSKEWSYNEETHWHACTDKGYENLKADEAEHVDSNEQIITEATDSSTGKAHYTCAVCGCEYEKVLKIKTSVVTEPTVINTVHYVGQKLSEIELWGGSGSVDGKFEWKKPDEKLSGNGKYIAVFVPDNENFASVECEVEVSGVIQLTVTVESGENGTASVTGEVNADYGEDFTVDFLPDTGFRVGEVIIDGESKGRHSSYTFEKLRENHTVSVSFEEYASDYEIYSSEGADNCWDVNGTTVTFKNITVDTVCVISGVLMGNIVIDTGDDCKFELEMRDFELISDSECPVKILSGDKVKLTAKKDTENKITDAREKIADDDETNVSAAVWSKVDLKLGGKGRLDIVSENNNGIHTKDDLEVENLSLTVTCCDNALKGNDGVTIESGSITLIAKTGDGIKTSNTDISSKGNQRGIVSLLGGEVNIFAACDGIDAAYDVVCEDGVVLNIQTDKYSEYSNEVTAVSSTDYYVRFTSNKYSYSFMYYNSENDYKWVNSEYHSSVSAGRTTYYYYKLPKETGYSQFKFFIYSSGQVQGQDEEYAACSDFLTWNTSYDTFALMQNGNSLSYSWTNYTTTITSDRWGGGMSDGNTDKSDHSTKGIKAGNEVIINGGELNIKSYDDAIHANNENVLENGEEAKGNVTINGGKITAYSNDDGIHADAVLTVNNGTVNITNSYEGLEGTTVNIVGGNIAIVSKDDGINATAKTGNGIVFDGGEVYIYAGGDGVDANTTTQYSGIIFNGGNIVVIQTSTMNSALDTERGYTYNGGNVVAIGPSGGMSSETTNCKNFSSVGVKATKSLSAGQYVVVTEGESTILTLKMPSKLSAIVVYLGSGSAKISAESSTNAALDGNGVCWSK